MPEDERMTKAPFYHEGRQAASVSLTQVGLRGAGRGQCEVVRHMLFGLKRELSVEFFELMGHVDVWRWHGVGTVVMAPPKGSDDMEV
jgi:hypothetical protein